ncbi:MAG: hypothetical protein GFH27_549291n322 [Chloroflexi bacterium AL-W]|nr:hypothetical protein [Chloroflexi bacterium AL-N1]NOK67210.1 hypothetical protein [Chloroflexi bacterium AL-N10]NOK75296.1 hypothetical protein [Chloroflexi bacterium AL-N5]NOK82084.1 hypothetical protein [Chloroflexi bacterium AL-W]NOK89929.1 hypothetical protein [Chloroflexi bacterium AL-N15]
MTQTEHDQSYDVVLREVEPQLMAIIRETVPSFGRPIAYLFDEVEAYVSRQQAHAVSGPLMVLHDAEYRATDCDIEVAVPLPQTIPANERVGVYELAGALMVCVVYTDSYGRLAEVLHTLLIWVDANAMAITGPLREVYVRQQPGNIILILGCRTTDQMQDNLGCLDFQITGEQLATLNAVADFNIGFPYSFLHSDNVRNLVFGDSFALLDNHRHP